MSLPALPPLPAATTELPPGLTAGRLDVDPVFLGPRRGRVRRWMYAAAGDEVRAVGAAVVDLGFAGTAFVWALVDGQVTTWERTRPLARGCRVGSLPAHGGALTGRDTVRIGGDGSLAIDVLPAGGSERLRARLTAGEVTPAVLVTGTAGGGWNVTQKAAGYAVSGELGWAGATTPFAGGGWRDWTAGRQDRRTSWHWAAGAGATRDGTARVGLNVSTGMNDAGAGEDVVWWDGVPSPLEASTLAPASGDVAGPWIVAGPGWRLELEPVGVRAADEQLVLVASRYVQPVGRFVGTLPGPDGRPRQVELTGVTERHVARW
ncbi:MAG: DUF2804 domain-containing protein [Actinobacteria bacterium]|nr:DUF2804 domain-containing protein [Actinomycetota bacterium]